jgi:dTDP-glucose 4,6-dehydratase
MKKYFDLVRFVKDRPGHDFRYSVDFSKIRDQLGWFPKINFQSGIRKTIEWYINNSKWVNSIKKNK